MLENKKLAFHEVKKDSELIQNAYHIFEPSLENKEIPLAAIDLFFLPLVAFDHQGHRLGLGGGYYDRTLENIKKINPQTKIIGLAYSLQEVPMVPADPWDVCLDAILTEKECRFF